MAEIASNLQHLAARWADARAGERANLQLYLVELCEALLLARPGHRGSGYEFELAVDAISVEGKEAANFVDCWKAGHFALEGKDDAVSRKGTASNEALLRRAYGQVRNYVHHVPGAAPPPYLMVLDVAKTLIVWDRWAGTYGGFEAGRRIDLATLHERPADVALLRDVWENPGARDRRGRAQAVTTEIAGRLAKLAAALEARGHGQEQVAQFLMRCVFSCFAEDIGLLPAESFRQTITEAGVQGSPAEFAEAVEGLWRLMDRGGRVGPYKFLRFNGHFFRDATALPLTRDEIALLEQAARADWSEVEPAIFGTLLTRALDPRERHRLGAEYTPPAFIERVVRPAVEEPVRERWSAVEAEVVQLTETGKAKDRERAAERLREFHAWLRGLRILDPACGSGNFLYVALHTLKRVELEVLRALERVTGRAELRLEEVDPRQFYGLEVKPWAREIAELTLWIGFHQFWRRHHDVQPPEPVLQDTGTLRHQDAVLAWDAVVRRPERDRQDPSPRVRHPVTGELVPDPAATLSYTEYVGGRPAEWPDADFIIGNPPFLGQFRQRDALGDGYVEALRAAYPDVPDSADLVMYWVRHAVEAVASGRTLRAGLITTQSITQRQNRRVFEDAAARKVRPAWAVADHFWNDGSDDARVRVAMLVLAKEPASATLVAVDGEAQVTHVVRVPRLNADLSAYADVPTAAAVPLRANARIAHRGFKPHGQGFVVPADEARVFLAADSRNAEVLKPFRNGMDITRRPRGAWLIDFGLRSQEEARGYPVLYDIVRDRVKPERDSNSRAVYVRYWWRFGEARPELREALRGLNRYIASPFTAKHGIFTFLDAVIAPDDALVCVASDDAYVLGVLSSAIHRAWALAAGSIFGIDGTPRYNKSTCFEPYPFPDATTDVRGRIAAVAEQIDAHRKAALSRSEAVGMTVMYNVVDKLRAGAPLTAAELAAHRIAACGVLRDLHDDLDRLVAAAYGWSWPAPPAAEPPALVLERLVALHDARVAEEAAGRVRWLRPEYQRPRFGAGVGAATEPDMEELALDEGGAAAAAAASPPAPALPWPPDAVGQITALRRLLDGGPSTAPALAGRFARAPRAIVERHLETLALLGEVVRAADGRYMVPAAAREVLGVA